MFEATLILLACAAAPCPAPPVIPGPPAPTKRNSEPLRDIPEPPSVDIVAEIETMRLATPWKFEPNGVLRTPTVTVTELTCAKNSFRYFACRYQLSVREFGAARFDPPQLRQSVFTQFGTDWVMYNEDRQCAEIRQKTLPAYCFPKVFPPKPRHPGS